jgi:uncharacterized protein YebE (UPF0316 family)
MDTWQIVQNSAVFSWIVLPLLIFLARICDVTIGTIRIIMVSKGNKLISPMLGFFEVLIWLIAIGQIMQNLNNIFCYIAYAGGFAAGNYIGILLEEKLAMGTLMIRLIVKDPSAEFLTLLRSQNFGTTIIEGQGSQGKVDVIYCLIKRADLEKVVNIIHQFHPKAFYSIEDVRLVREGIFPQGMSWFKSRFHPTISQKAKQK